MTLILVVDDDPRICDLLEALLNDEGYETRRARDGLEALHELAQARPDLIVTDLMMPRLDGAGLIDRLRRDGLHIPIIVLSAVPDTVRELPVAAFVAKPFDLNYLADTVNRTLADRA